MANIYMKIMGISGTASAGGYQKAIILHSVNFGMQRNINTRIGQVSDREGAIPTLSEVTITKSTDSASNDLLTHFLNGSTIAQVEIHLCTTDSTPQAYVKYLLKDVLIAQYLHGVVADSKPVEKLRLNYTQIQLTYAGRDHTNKALSPSTTGYDLEKAKAL